MVSDTIFIKLFNGALGRVDSRTCYRSDVSCRVIYFYAERGVGV